MLPHEPAPGWRPTASHLSSAIAAIVLLGIAVLARRPDALVLATPFAVIAGWGALTRPGAMPTVRHRLQDAAVREGEATVWRATVTCDPNVDVVTAVVPPAKWLQLRPADGVVTVASDARSGGRRDVEIELAVRATRWGHLRMNGATLVASSRWTAFRWTGQTGPSALRSLPLPSVFDSAVTNRPRRGLVGIDRSSLPGDGSEFAGVREFRAGDRLRRINWPRSLRAGALHVTSTWADQDTLVVLEVDATDDIGLSEGIDGSASSLDLALRAAGAIAHHALQRGDRVSLRVFGSSPSRSVAPASGQLQLRRVLEALAAIRAGSDPRGQLSRGRLAVSPDALVIMLSPLVSVTPLDRAVALAQRGLSVVVVDTLPTTVVEDPDSVTALAWRIRLLERDREVRRAQRAGVAVVQWRGPGSLDEFLRGVARRASAPRLARR